MSSPILAGSLGECCFKAVKHEGTPAGRTDIIAGVPTYLSEPPSAETVQETKVVLYFADVYGPLHINNQLVQDYFASQGSVSWEELPNAGNQWRAAGVRTSDSGLNKAIYFNCTIASQFRG
ncbi:hypothetical protein EDD85DRAFT_982934 [Armillaria nabsnona]|nr:hypothetical protein EDD85DRAFT_982934 [Armillaria nabsnona]